MKKSQLISLFFAFTISLPLLAVEKKVYWEQAPFVPCALCDVFVQNCSFLSLQISTVKKGETVRVIAWAENDRDVLVELRDGSRGYMPAICFMKGGLEISVGEKTYVFVNHEDQVAHNSRNKRYLSEGVYNFETAKSWAVSKYGLNPAYLVATSPISSKKYYVKNDYLENPSYSEWIIKSLVPGDLQELGYEVFEEKTLFLDDGNRHVLTNYIGETRNELESTLGKPDTWISASRSRNGQTELFYRNICFVDGYFDSRYLIKGAVFLVDDSGRIADAYPDGYTEVRKKDVRYEKLPIPGEEQGTITKEDLKTDRRMNWQSFKDYFYEFLGRPKYLLILLYTILLSFILCWIEWWKVRKGWKIGRNRFAKVTTFLFVFFPVFFFNGFLVDTGPFWINVLLAVGITYVFSPLRYIDKCRCEHCGKYLDDRYIKSRIEKPVMVEKKNGLAHYYREYIFIKKCDKCGSFWQYTERCDLDE